MLRRQELLDRIRQEQLAELNRPRSYTERRRYTPDPLPPPSRHSLPDLHRHHYHCNYVNKHVRQKPDMSQVKHVIEHKFRQPEANVQTYTLPPIASPPAVIASPPAVIQPTMAAAPAYAAISPPPPVITTLPTSQIHTLDLNVKPAEQRGTWFNKGDFMDMMMFQNAQMHHMAMQQLMVKNLTPQQQQPPPVMPVAAPAIAADPYIYPRPVYHHHYNALAAPAAPAMYHHQAFPSYDMSGGFYPFQ